jgi:hypothetical protein
MAYNNLPFEKDMHDQPFFSGNMAGPEIYDQDIQIHESWMQNVDPLVRQAQNRNTNPSG